MPLLDESRLAEILSYQEDCRAQLVITGLSERLQRIFLVIQTSPGISLSPSSPAGLGVALHAHLVAIPQLHLGIGEDGAQAPQPGRPLRLVLAVGPRLRHLEAEALLVQPS